MDAKERNKAKARANKALAALEIYTADFSAWIGKVKAIMQAAGFTVELDGMFFGENSRCDEPAIEADGKTKIDLHISWYKMPSGRYELQAYLI